MLINLAVRAVAMRVLSVPLFLSIGLGLFLIWFGIQMMALIEKLEP